MNKKEKHPFDSIDSADYTAESIAASLIKNGVLPEQIFLKSTGTSKRAYKKDVTISTTSHNENQDDTLFFLESPREGLYDALPESIFHSFNGKNNKNKYEIIEEIKKHREEENQARLFFNPFEQQFFNIRRILFSFEDTFESASTPSSLIEIFKAHYPILNHLPIKKAYLFIRLIPFIHEIRDDFKKVEECLSILLDSAVTIAVSFKQQTINACPPPGLGAATLGTNMIIGNCIQDGEPDLDIVINPNSATEMNSYASFEKNKKIAEQLCDFLIGAHYAISIAYKCTVQENTLSNALLGYNAYL